VLRVYVFIMVHHLPLGPQLSARRKS